MKRAKRLLKRIPKNRKARLGLFAIAFAIVGTALILFTQAASPFVSLEPENATLAGPATKLADTTASGGSTLKFGSSGATGGVNCPLTYAAKACWMAHTGPDNGTGIAGSITEAQIKAGVGNYQHITGQVDVFSDHWTLNGTTRENDASINHYWIEGCIQVWTPQFQLTDSLLTWTGQSCSDNGCIGQGILIMETAQGIGCPDVWNSGTGPGGQSARGYPLALIKNVTVDAHNLDPLGYSSGMTNFPHAQYHCIGCQSVGFSKGFGALADVKIDDSMTVSHMDNTYQTPTESVHLEDVWMTSGHYTIINHSWFGADKSGQHTTAALSLGADYGWPHDTIIQNNYFNGFNNVSIHGPCPIYNACGSEHSGPAAANNVITGNVSSNMDNGPMDSPLNWSINTWSNNYRLNESTGALTLISPP